MSGRAGADDSEERPRAAQSSCKARFHVRNAELGTGSETMCGIAGLLYTGPRQSGPLGEHMLRMLDVLGSRGVDGTGVALYGPPQPDALIFRVWLGGGQPPAEQAERAIARIKAEVATLLDAEVRD